MKYCILMQKRKVRLFYISVLFVNIQYYLQVCIYKLAMWIIVEDSRENMNSTGSGEMLLYNNGGEKEFVSVVFKEENF